MDGLKFFYFDFDFDIDGHQLFYNSFGKLVIAENFKYPIGTIYG